MHQHLLVNIFRCSTGIYHNSIVGNSPPVLSFNTSGRKLLVRLTTYFPRKNNETLPLVHLLIDNHTSVAVEGKVTINNLQVLAVGLMWMEQWWQWRFL